MRALILSAIALAAVLLNAPALWSQPVFPSENIAAQRAALEQAHRQATEARGRSELLENRAEQADVSADRLQRQILAMAARIQEAEANITAAEARIAIIAGLQREQRARLAEKQQPMVRLGAALEHLARRPVALSLVQPGSVRDMARLRAVMASMLPLLKKRTAGLRAEVDRGRQLRAQAERAAAGLKTGRTELDLRQKRMARLEVQRRIESRRLASSAVLESDRAIALGEEASSIEGLVDTIGEAGKVREALQSLDGPVLRPPRPGASRVVLAQPPRFPVKRPAYRFPVVGRVVTGLGELSDSGVRSRGLTVAVQPGAQVVAPADGRVGFAGPYPGYGQIVIIEHAGDWTSLITSLARLSVAVGDDVQQGSPIGRAGRDRPTVTVELRRAGRPVDIARLVANN